MSSPIESWLLDSLIYQSEGRVTFSRLSRKEKLSEETGIAQIRIWILILTSARIISMCRLVTGVTKRSGIKYLFSRGTLVYIKSLKKIKYND